MFYFQFWKKQKKQNDKFKDKIIELVNKILLITKFDNSPEDPLKKRAVNEFEKQINQLVYKLYGLTPEEIEVVEGRKNE